MPLLKREPDLYPPDLFSAGGESRPWWAAHVRSRQEKSLARHLLERHLPFYLPQQEKRVAAHGRVRTSHLPLFPGYVFFRGGSDERLAVLRSQLVVRTLEVRDQPLLDAELARLWRLQATGALLVPHEWLGPGDEVKVTEGPFRGFTGTVVREGGSDRLIVSVTLLRRAVAATFSRDQLAPATPGRS